MNFAPGRTYNEHDTWHCRYCISHLLQIRHFRFSVLLQRVHSSHHETRRTYWLSVHGLLCKHSIGGCFFRQTNPRDERFVFIRYWCCVLPSFSGKNHKTKFTCSLSVLWLDCRVALNWASLAVAHLNGMWKMWLPFPGDQPTKETRQESLDSDGRVKIKKNNLASDNVATNLLHIPAIKLNDIESMTLLTRKANQNNQRQTQLWSVNLCGSQRRGRVSIVFGVKVLWGTLHLQGCRGPPNCLTVQIILKQERERERRESDGIDRIEEDIWSELKRGEMNWFSPILFAFWPL